MKMTIGLAAGVLLLTSQAFAGDPPATGFKITKLVSNVTGGGKVVDPNLVNAWGLSQAPGGPVWVSDQGTNLSTVYNRTTGQIQSIVVNVAGGPTGTVYASPSLGFTVTENGKSGAATFLFDTTSGTISGWAQSVDPTNAVVAVNNNGSGASYTGLAIDDSAKLLFAANSTQNKVEIYNNKFQLVSSFTDTSLPSGFTPFNVMDVNGTVYVAFASPTFGAGLGYVDTFNTSGVLQKQLIAKGKLNAPWGLAIAPSKFGAFANDLLVGNLGDGRMHAYDPSTGAYLGSLNGKTGKPLSITGLWALDSGPGTNQVNFSAGPAGYADGLFGLITPLK